MALQYNYLLRKINTRSRGIVTEWDYVKSPTLRANELSTVLSATRFSTILTSASSDNNPDLYNELSDLAIVGQGTIDPLYDFDNMANNQSFRLWNPDLGESNYLEFEKNVSGSSTPNLYGRVKSSIGSSDLTWYVFSDLYNANLIFQCCSIGFVYDPDNNIGNYIIVYTRAVKVSDTRNNIYRQVMSATTSSNTTKQNNLKIGVAALVAGNEYIPPEPSENPYSDGSFSEPSGDPTGDYDDTSDVISVPSIPSFNLGITSLINVWVPSTTDINNLANYLWSNFDLTDPTKTLSKMFTDPLSYILSLHMLPFTVDSSTAITVTLAGLATTVSMPPATVQFKDIDCGSVTINEYWGNYLDYTYTKIVLCLPFCGQVDLDPDEVMGQTIKVKYRVDIITGAFVCFVYIDGDKVLGQYAGNCAAQIPISAADFSRLNAAVLGVAGAAASAFGGAALGGQGGMLNGASGGLLSSIAANAQNAKVRAQHSGGLTGAPGFMGIQKPYLIIHRPRQSVPEDYEQFKGYPSNVTMQLSSCTGFTSVREIKLNGLPFTDGELTELKSILEGGVIL